MKTTYKPHKSMQGQIQSSQEANGNFENKESVKVGKLLPVCYRCTQVPKEGLYDGFRVQGMFFCSKCQNDLFKAEQGSPEYQEFMFLIKGIFY